MHLKLICCEVLTREAGLCAAASPHSLDIEFTEKGAHERSDFLRKLIQSKIDAADASPRKYDAILLGFGLCGNSTLDLIARRSPLVMPRAHDCCTLFLGSKARFKELCGNCPSQPFSSTGYLEREGGYSRKSNSNPVLGGGKTYQDYVDQYGEEDAKYILETLTQSEDTNKTLLFIDIPETTQPALVEECRKVAQADGKEFKLVQGDLRLVRKMIMGEWDSGEFLVVKPGQKIGGVWDFDEIVRAKDIDPQQGLG